MGAEVKNILGGVYMSRREAIADKIFVLGVDGLDPRFSKKMLREGKMPNMQKLIDAGAAREDLVLLGGHPTVTPPMWTTLSTGCYANVHGITGFFRRVPGQTQDVCGYNLDARLCKAEQLWHVFAEAGKKTCVFHWPGCAWPPISDNPNLMIIDGSSPGTPCIAGLYTDKEHLVVASDQISVAAFRESSGYEGVAPCLLTDIPDDQSKVDPEAITIDKCTSELRTMICDLDHHQIMSTETPIDIAQSPLKPASGWGNAPKDALEFTMLNSNGLVRRLGLLCKGVAGHYDEVRLFKSKKDAEPFVVLKEGEMIHDIIDDVYRGDNKILTNRSMKLLQVDPAGKSLIIFVSTAFDCNNDSLCSPSSLFWELQEKVGYFPPVSQLGQQDPMLISDCMLVMWEHAAQWQAKAINYLIQNKNTEIIFSHMHNVDMQEHMFIKFLSDRSWNRKPHEVYEQFMEDIYTQTDRYIGEFLHLLDEGWTILVVSDHAQVAGWHDVPLLQGSGITTPVMEQLGYTVMVKDADGNNTKEVDWSKTRAVASDVYIYLNLIGREPYGIVAPEDQYELEEQIITDLYSYKDKKTGHRVVSLALRNRDAILIGLGGPECGDIVFMIAEGYNYDHSDCLSTTYGAGETSVSPIFIAAGKGIKKGCVTERHIRQVDVAATMAYLGGVRMPAQCEGAPIYQIFEEEF